MSLSKLNVPDKIATKPQRLTITNKTDDAVNHKAFRLASLFLIFARRYVSDYGHKQHNHGMWL